MQTALYLIWSIFPLFFFILGLWALLEKKSNKHARAQNPDDFFRQGFFVLLCVLASVGIDRFILPKIISDEATLNFTRIVLLPVVFWIGGMIVGPSQAITISKARKTPPNQR
jgi:TM2 domain-containing membrane protein YozV